MVFIWNMIRGKIGVIRYGINVSLHRSYSCAINTGDSVLITGGYYDLPHVVEYDKKGTTGRNLPQLLQGRRSHGCSAFVNDQGTKVRL